MLCFPQQVPPWVTIDAVIRMWPLNPNWLDCKDCNREWVHKLQPFFEYIWKEGSVVTTNIPPCSGGGDTIRRRSTKRGQLEKNISKTKIKKGEWEVSPCTLWQYLWTSSDGIWIESADDVFHSSPAVNTLCHSNQRQRQRGQANYHRRPQRTIEDHRRPKWTTMDHRGHHRKPKKTT